MVKSPNQDPPIYIRHCPHRPNDTPESAELHSSSKMEYLVRNTLLGQLCCVTSRQEGKLSIRELRLYDVKQLKVLLFMKFERSLEWFSWLEYSMAHNMRELMMSEA